MEIISGPRQSGKTTTLIEWLAADKGRRMIVAFEGRREDVVRDIFKRGYQQSVADRVLTVATVKLAPHSALLGVGSLLVDDVEAVLPVLLGAPVSCATVSEGNVRDLAIPPPVEAPVGEESLCVTCETCGMDMFVDSLDEAVDRSREHAGHKVKVGKKVNCSTGGLYHPYLGKLSQGGWDTVNFVAMTIRSPVWEIQGWETRLRQEFDDIELLVTHSTGQETVAHVSMSWLKSGECAPELYANLVSSMWLP